MKAVKVFISSTFKDMNAERDVLIKNVFPRLREKAEPLGIRLQEIDLRWGVTEEEVKKGEVLDLCLDGIEECKPYFICMLGRRYGWIPAPAYIKRDEFELLLSNSNLNTDEKSLLKGSYYLEDNGRGYRLEVSSANEEKDNIQKILEKSGLKEAGLSITAREIDYVISEDRLPHSIPCLDKLIAKGILDQTITLEEMSFLLQFYTRYGAEQIWRKQPGTLLNEETRIRDILGRLGYKRDYHRFFFIRKEAGNTKYPLEYFYKAGDRNYIDSGYVETDPGKREKLEQFKEEIRASGRYCAFDEYPCTWDSSNAGSESEGLYPVTGLQVFEELLFNSIWNHMMNNPQLQQEGNRVKTLIERENEEHLKFIDSRTYNFCGRDELLNELEAAVDKALQGKLVYNGLKTQAVLITGEPGAGKSSVLAQFYNRYSVKHSDYLIIPRFIGGGSSRSASPRQLLMDFCTILIDASGINAEIPSEQKELEKAFRDYISKVKGSIVIILDALNQLQAEDCAREMMWLPGELPENVCILASTALEKEGNAALESARKRLLPFEVPVKKLSSDEKKEIINTYLRQFNKKLRGELVQHIADKQEAHHPLYLQAALEELRLISRHEELEDFVLDKLPGTAIEMFSCILDRYEKELERRLGKNLFKDFMIYIAAGRSGMGEEDLRLLMGDWKNIKDKGIAQVRIPDFQWGELRRAMRPYLMQRGDEWDFFHLQLKQAVVKRYIDSEVRRQKVHSSIVEYLELMGLEHPTTIRDLPYHIIKAGYPKERLESVLCSLWFLEYKVRSGMAYELKEDFEIALETHGDMEKAKLYYTFVSQEILSLNKGGRQPLYTIQEAYNHSISGDAAKSAEKFIKESGCSSLMLLKAPMQRKDLNNRPANIATLYDEHLGSYEDSIIALDMTRDGKKAVAAIRNGFLKIWDVNKNICINDINLCTGITAVKFLNNGKSVVFTREDKSLNTYDIDCDRKLMTWGNYTSPSKCLSVTPDGRYALTGHSDGTVQLWDIGKQACLKVLQKHTQRVLAVDITPDGRWAVSAGRDGLVILWDLETGNGKVFSGHNSYINAVRITSEGSYAVSGGDDKTIKIWDLVKEKLFASFQNDSEITSLGITDDMKLIISGSGSTSRQSDEPIQILDVKRGYVTKSYSGHKHAINFLEVTSDGRYALSASFDNTLRMWDVENGTDVIETENHKDYVYDVKISPDGMTSFSMGNDKRGRTWDMATGKCLQTAAIPNGYPKDSITSLDYRFSFILEGNTFSLVDNSTGRKVIDYKGHEEYVDTIRISADGMLVISRSRQDHTTRIWDLYTGKCLSVIEREEGSSIEMEPSGRLIVTGGEYSPIRKIWDLRTRDCIAILKGHKHWIWPAKITPDGRYVITGSWDQTIRFWDIENGENIYTFYGSDGEYRCLDYNIKGSLIAGAGNNALIYNVKGLDTDLPIVTAKRVREYNGIFGKLQESVSVNCLWCGSSFPLTDYIKNNINNILKTYGISKFESPVLRLPDEAWNNKGLVFDCPKCGGRLKSNPFIIENKILVG